MIFVPFSEKQLKILKWWNDPAIADKYTSLICDGAIRSGKTSIMMISYITWAMETFNECDFAICGKTVRSAERNVIVPFMRIPSMRKRYQIKFTRSLNCLTVVRGDVINYFHIFGGKDESSQDLIQGITLAGILLDEVALMPESFVNQALSRCSVENARRWFNCNPKSSNHWFYKEWILNSEKKHALHLHFLLPDNPSLSKKKLDEYYSMYSGVFHRRYILGEWVPAEGLVYKIFADDNERYLIDDVRKYLKESRQTISVVMIGVDFGGNKSATTFSAVGITRNARTVILLAERYISPTGSAAEPLTPDKLNKEYALFVNSVTKIYGSGETRADSAETILIRGLYHTAQSKKLQTVVKNALKIEINDRIALTNLLMSQDRLKINKSCVETIDAFNNAVYDDEEPTEDVRLDDGTSNIDSLDAFEYAIEPHYKELENSGWR